MINYPIIDPIIYEIGGGLAISWYSLSYVIGILAGAYMAKRIVINKSINMNENIFDDYISYFIIGIIIGGRLFYVFFYDPSKFYADPLAILKTYEGGMSFHGGLVGALISTYIYTKNRKVSFFSFLDILASVAPFGIMLGRVANFINAELYGRVTNAPWGMIFPHSDGLVRHPSQLYQAFFEGLLLFIILQFLVYRKNILKFRGLTSAFFIMLYAIFRFVIEFFREPDYQIGYLMNYFTQGQILCIPMFIAGFMIIYCYRKTWN